MPRFKLVDPKTGEEFAVEAPSPPSQEAAREFIKRQRAKKAEKTVMDSLNADIGAVESFLIGTGRGFMDIGRGLGLVGEEDDTTKKAFEDLEERRPVSQFIGRATGQTAPFIPLTGAALGSKAVQGLGIAGRSAAAGTAGAAEGAIVGRGTGRVGEGTEEGAIIGGAVGAGAELVMPKLSKFASRIFRNVTGIEPKTPLIRKGRPTPELQRALDEAGIEFDDLAEGSRLALQNGDLADPNEVARLDFFRKNGIEPTRAQVTRDATDFQTQQELFKTSGPVRRSLDTQQEQLVGLMDNAVSRTGGSLGNNDSAAFNFVSDQAIDADAAVSSAYTAIRESAPNEASIIPENLVRNIKRYKGAEQSTDGLYGGAMGILRDNGLVDGQNNLIRGNRNAQRALDSFEADLRKSGRRVSDSGNVFNDRNIMDREATEKLAALTREAKAPTSRLTPEQAENVRIELNKLYDSVSDYGRMGLRDIKDGLDQDVGKQFPDLFAPARQKKIEFEKRFGVNKKDKFDKRNKSILMDIVENKVNPDQFVKDAVLSNRVRADDLSRLKSFYLDGSDEGRAAWNEIRYDVMDKIRQRAVRSVGDQEKMTRSSMEIALRQVPRKKLDILFSKSELNALDDIQRLTRLVEPVSGTQQGRGPSAQAIMGLSSKLTKLGAMGDVFGGLVDEFGGARQIRPRLTGQAERFEEAAASIMRPGAVSTATANEDEQ